MSAIYLHRLLHATRSVRSIQAMKAVGTMSDYDPLHLAMPLSKSGKELLVL